MIDDPQSSTAETERSNVLGTQVSAKEEQSYWIVKLEQLFGAMSPKLLVHCEPVQFPLPLTMLAEQFTNELDGV